MLVIKRDGRKESVKFDKITARIEKLSYGLNTKYVKTIEIAKKVIDGLYDGVSTQELDELAAETIELANWKNSSDVSDVKSSISWEIRWSGLSMESPFVDPVELIL